MFFNGRKKNMDFDKLQKSFDAIVSGVAEKSGISRCVRFENDTVVAFSGSIDEPDLLLVVSIDTDNNLSASLDDEVSWNEFDFENTDEFIEEIVNYIAPLINHTVKYIKEYKKHTSIRFRTLMLDEEKNEWITIADDTTDEIIIRPLIFKDKTEEKIKVYSI